MCIRTCTTIFVEARSPFPEHLVSHSCRNATFHHNLTPRPCVCSSQSTGHHRKGFSIVFSANNYMYVHVSASVAASMGRISPDPLCFFFGRNEREFDATQHAREEVCTARTPGRQCKGSNIRGISKHSWILSVRVTIMMHATSCSADFCFPQSAYEPGVPEIPKFRNFSRFARFQ